MPEGYRQPRAHQALAGISSYFKVAGIRLGSIRVGAALLVLAAIQILQLPRPPA